MTSQMFTLRVTVTSHHVPGDQINKKYWDIFFRGRRGGGGLYEKFNVLYETWLQDFGMGQIDWALCQSSFLKMPV